MWYLQLRESYPSYLFQGDDVISHVTMATERCLSSLPEQASINSQANNLP